MQEYLKSDGSNSVLAVWVVAGASRTRIMGTYGTALKIAVACPPEHGRANRTLVEFLRGVFGAPVEILSGAADRRKRIRVELTVTQAEAALAHAQSARRV